MGKYSLFSLWPTICGWTIKDEIIALLEDLGKAHFMLGWKVVSY